MGIRLRYGAPVSYTHLYAAIGYGGMTIANCLPKLKEEWQKLKACLLYTSRCV